jgi:hypothetical protein
VSNADKRTVSTDALETLGTIIDANQKRDAIHLAVIPAICADSWLAPGTDVLLTEAGARACSKHDPFAIGIVDPFLHVQVNLGEHFWLVIYPRVITSLRHVWTHPQLPDEGPQAANSSAKAASEAWLRNRADGLGITYEEIVEAGTSREYPGCFGNDIYGDRDIEQEFWFHVEVVAGDVCPPDKRPTWFRCAC